MASSLLSILLCLISFAVLSVKSEALPLIQSENGLNITVDGMSNTSHVYQVNSRDCGDPEDEITGEKALNAILAVVSLAPDPVGPIGTIIGAFYPFFIKDHTIEKIKDYVDCEIANAIDKVIETDMINTLRGMQDLYQRLQDTDTHSPDYKVRLISFIDDAIQNKHHIVSQPDVTNAIQYFRVWVSMHMSVAAELIRLTNDPTYLRDLQSEYENTYRPKATKIVDEFRNWRDSYEIKRKDMTFCSSPSICGYPPRYCCLGWNCTTNWVDTLYDLTVATVVCERSKCNQHKCEYEVNKPKDDYVQKIHSEIDTKWHQPIDQWDKIMMDLKDNLAPTTTQKTLDQEVTTPRDGQVKE